MRKKFSIIAFILFAGSTYGQDFVVTVKNDTMRGSARILTYDVIDHIEIRVDSDKKKTSLTAVQVKAVVISKETFNPVKTEKGYRMMKLISPGHVARYQARSASNAYDTDYLVRSDGDAIEIPNLSFKRILSEFLKDCYTIKATIESKDYKKKDIDAVLQEYNQCIVNQTTQRQNLVPLVSEKDPLLVALNTLQDKIVKDTELKNRKDALDVTNDIITKVKNRQKVPNYLLEGLKDFLKDSPAYQSDLENVSSLLKGK